MGSKFKCLCVVIVAAFFLSFVFISCDPNPALKEYVGTWLIVGSFLYNWDVEPETMNATINQTMILNDDMTFTMTGTNQWEGQSVNTLEGNGTYIIDEETSGLEMTLIYFTQNGTPMTPAPANYQYEVQGDTLTLTSPGVAAWVAYTPAEPLLYTRQ